ncbi:MAG: S8 family serine peptidase [Clostridia bacterium]|nr:S8 family serine peptidase [Clostridia bacterium]
MNKFNMNRIITMFLIIVIIVCISFAMIYPSSIGQVFAESKNNIESKTLEFADDRILVVLTGRATKSFRDYTAEDFSDIGVSEVNDLTKLSKEKLRKQLNERDTNNRSNDYELTIDKISYRRILCLTLANKGRESVLKAIELLKQREDIISAEPDCVLHVEATNPNDPDYQDDEQWGLNGNYGINAPSAWSYTAGSSTVRVGIIDTGIDADHEDLSANVNTSLSRDFSLAEPYIPAAVVDSGYHGTHVAGIIGAVGNNGIGITGVAQSIELVSLKIYPSSGHDSFVSNLILAIDYATSADIPILNNSNGTDSYSGTEDSLSAFSTAINNYPGLFVTSAGNGNRDNDLNDNRFPKLQLSNTITVGAINSTGSKAYYSNYGEISVDIFAPGDGILSTYPTALCEEGSCDFNLHYEDGYHYLSGTSMAAPHVAGTAALLLSYNPNLTAKQLKYFIKEGVITMNTLSGKCVSGGRLNTYNALTRLYNHVHSYTYQAIDIYKHWKTCECGYQVQANHTYVECHVQSLQPIAEPEYRIEYVCSKCGYNSGPFAPYSHDENECA